MIGLFSTHIFSVPKETPLRVKWIAQIRRHQEFDDQSLCSYPVCSLHFDSDKIMQSGKRTTLKKGTLPTIFPE